MFKRFRKDGRFLVASFCDTAIATTCGSFYKACRKWESGTKSQMVYEHPILDICIENLFQLTPGE